MKSFTQLVVRVEPTLKDRFDKKARKNGMTIQSAVAQALTSWIDKKDKDLRPND